MTETLSFSRAAVAAPHNLAAESGKAVLQDGGNAIEAMVAMAATIAVVYPHMNSIGGDGFWLIREPSGAIHAIEACGYAGQLATIERYAKKGYDILPQRGVDAALTVPGAIGGWMRALEGSKVRGGKMPLRQLLHDAIGHASNGVITSRSESRLNPNQNEALVAVPGFAELYLKDGKQPGFGSIRKFVRQAETLEQLARAGLDDFYRGDIAREMAVDLEAVEAPLTRVDLHRYEAKLRRPLSTALKGATIYNCPPPTQGIASLILLGIFEQLGIKRVESFEHIHGLVEATKRALAIRDRVVTDFDHVGSNLADMLTQSALKKEADRISMAKSAAFPLLEQQGDTVWMGAIDATGMAVSYIQSTYWEYGSGLVLPRTGILMQNRGVSFSLDPRAVNPLQPGRRPFHTLNPAMAVFEDGRIVPYGSMGGDGQPQFQAQIFSRYRFGAGIAEAIDAPRYLLGRTWGSTSTSLKLEDRFDPDLVRALERIGQSVEVVPHSYDETFGHAGMLVRHAQGRVEAAHDPRSDGGPAGL